MTNEINYYKTAKWVTLLGNFTSNELRDIAEKIDNPDLQETPESDKGIAINENQIETTIKEG